MARWIDFYVRMNLRDGLELRRPRAGVLYYFVTGAAKTFRYRVDKAKGVFAERSA
jgi:hypothetical protein